MMAECATKDRTTLRAKLALEIPAVYWRFPWIARFLACSSAGGLGGLVKSTARVLGSLRPFHQKVTRYFKETTHVKDIALITAVK